MFFDICIIGGGAAGLMASIFAGRGGGKVALIERNTSVGRKLLKTGRGRCNYAHVGDVREFVKKYGYCGRFLRYCLYEFTAEDTVSFFENLGVKGKVEKGGCVFPASGKAGSVKNALLDEAERAGVRFVYGRRVENIVKDGGGFVVSTADAEIQCKAVIIACGGKSWPGLGSDGDGYRFAEELGHSIIKPKPAVVGLVSEDESIKQLQGVAVADVFIWARVAEKSVSERGPVMFTGKGIGGPAVLNFSRFIVDMLNNGGRIDVFVDLLPGVDRENLRERFLKAAERLPKKKVVGCVSEMLPKRLACWILNRVGVGEDVRFGQAGKTGFNNLVEAVKRFKVPVKETGGFAEATITRGGISLDEIDDKTMESKICPGLFFAGEVIDADGPCGGYNLQIAWSTGALAGAKAIMND